MSKKIKVKPSKGNSLVGFIGGLVFCLIGVFVVVPIFKGFGVFWLLIAILITATHGYNAFSDKGISDYEIEVNEIDTVKEVKSQDKKESYPEMLRELKELRDDGIITYEEYEVKKSEIMNKEW